MHWLVALLVFAIGLGATFYYWQNLRHGAQDNLDTTYARQSQMITETIETRLQLYQNILQGSAGLFAVHNSLTQAEWDKYHSLYDFEKNYPAVRAIGASRYLKNDDVPAYLEQRSAEGISDFKITPEGTRDVFVPITFSSQYHDAVVLHGYDEYTEPVRRKAMERAVELNQLTMSGLVTLPASTEGAAEQRAFILYLPVYGQDMPTGSAAERWMALRGFVHVTVDEAIFVNLALALNQNPNMALRLSDAEAPGSSQPAFESSNFAAIQHQKGSKVATTPLKLHGHTWRATFAASPNLISERDRQLPQQALWRGLITCIFFAGLVWYLITDRERKYARQKKEEVQTAKDDLLSLASHQLRTPATVVKQYVGMLLQGYAGKLTAQQIDMLDNAYESNERQLEIINQLLYVARLDAGRIKLHAKKTDLANLIRGVAHDHTAAIKTRQQKLSLNLPKRPLLVELDPHYMRMVIENLVSNAIKYTPEKGKISLSLKREPGEVVVAVKDSGVGLPPEAKASIFEKFTRIENELSNDVNGSGVGLYLTKQIVELHHGTITVESAAGHGSTFLVRIPARIFKAKDSAQ